jgi:hypothetical protein
MSRARELLSYQPSNVNTIFLLCTCCTWGLGLQPASGGLATQEEVDQEFKAHICEEYAKN